jgi:hypothetical protein
MSTVDDSGQKPEQQTPPTDANGSPSEVDRSVQGTGLPGFAELRSRAEKVKQRARAERADFKARKMKYHEGASFGEFRLAVELLRWLDELSRCEECS